MLALKIMMRLRMFILLCVWFALSVLAAACTPPPEIPQMTIHLVADDRLRSYGIRDPITVGEFLRLPEVNVELGELDDVVPPLFTQLNDGMQIKVSRVREEFPCETREIPYERVTIQDPRLEPGQERQGERGSNGQEEVCYRVRIVDGVERSRVQNGPAITIREAVNETVFIGPTTSLDPVDFRGTIAFVSLNNAWVMRGSSSALKVVTNTNDVVPAFAFGLSSNGRQLLYARNPQPEAQFYNELWLIPDVGAPEPQPVELPLGNVLSASWVPGRPNTISYSLADPRDNEPFYTAKNDLWIASIDPQTGVMTNTEQLIEGGVGTGGAFSWYGARYEWSPDSQQLAWIHADAVGTVNLSTGELNPPLLNYAVYSLNRLRNWSWRTDVTWSPDNAVLAAVTHGDPLGSERAETSPVFNLTVAAADGTFRADLVSRIGVWAVPKFSPLINDGSEFPKGYLAYFVAREALNSASSEYDLYVADRDGSNARKIFPEDGKPGIRTQQYAWSPDGTQIVVVYQDNLWLINVASATARQLTLSGNASHPVWMQ